MVGRPREKGAVVSLYTPLRALLAGRSRQGHNSFVRALLTVLVAAALLLGVYYFYFKKMPTTDEGVSPTQAIRLTGVRGDLLEIAHAEGAHIAANGRCASLDELISSNTLAMSRTERDGYAYAVECSTGEFNVTARHAPAAAGSPIRYPNFAIEATLEIREVH